MGAPLPSSRTLIAATLATLVLAAAAVGLLGAVFWTEDVVRGRLFARMLCAVLALLMTEVAAYRFFFSAVRSRRRRWQRAYAILLFVWAGYLFVLALRGV
jgi:hypothetical protein